MAFFAAVIETIVKAAVIAAVAVGGVMCGKKLRDRKDSKASVETEE